MVKRFDLVGEYDNTMQEVEDGDYVLYSDYKKLEEKDYVDFGEVSRWKLGIQCQYGSRYLHGK